ncbi:hypothetical protein CSA80_00870 [Candidatus Saccharibacteria bacterium]|nr:MAG: hypothetical protein CR973_02285 [Candidatus Saccharibacteria bacterium]PID99307.1 MAG: hypothetical protein CSA80_00870 [Candidatus Saccharibacteria bacterium]
MKKSQTPELEKASDAEPSASAEPAKLPPQRVPKERKLLYVAVGVIFALTLALVGTHAGWFDKSDSEQKTAHNTTQTQKAPSDQQAPPSTQTSQKTKEACAKHSKICFPIPDSWSSKLTVEKDEDYQQNNPDVQGFITIERLSLFDDQGRKKITFMNRYGSPDFSGGWGMGGACVGTMNRTVVHYKRVNFTSYDAAFKNNKVVQAVVDTIDPATMETFGKPFSYEAHIELASHHPQANQPGDYTIDCDVTVMRGMIPGLTQPFDNIEVSVMLSDRPITTKAQGVAELDKNENVEAFKIIAGLYQKTN